MSETSAAPIDGWRTRLAGAPALADIPTDRSRPARPSGTIARFAGSPVSPVGDEALLGALAALLHRYTGQDDVLIALAASDDSVHVVRSDSSHAGQFDEFASATETARAAAVALPPLPARAVGSCSTAERELPAVHLLLADAQHRDCAERLAAQFDLTIAREATTLEWHYATDLFDAFTIERMHGHLGRLLDEVERGPQRPLAQIPLLSDAERHQLTVEWNDTRRPFSDGRCVHELIADQVARTPDAIAVVFGDEQRSYRELDEQSNRIARHLVTLGVGRGALVGLYLERSATMVEALLGILKAGAAYVPLDPNFPPDRLALMIEDSGLRVIVTQTSLMRALALPHDVTQVVLDGERDRDVIATQSCEPLASDVSCRDLMYVIYTSGSTGKPKGVMLEHRSVVNFLETMAEAPGLAAHDRLLAVTTLSFDIAGLEIYLPLIVGATVVVASRATTVDPQALMAALARHDITVMQATPATWRLLVEAGWTGDTRLKVLCGGEALPPPLAAALVDRAGEVWNMYGPTETTIWSTIQQVIPGAPVSIGRPIANTTLYVLDAELAPVPIGVAGELLIGGDGLARGYHGLAELTADRFVDDPFAAPDQRATGVPARLYRTGDLVRYRADGRIEFLGRIDHQVKVRGFRIELGEIETVLARHPAVEEAVVLARDDGRGEKRLVAYVVLGAGRMPAGAGPRERSERAVNASKLRRSVQDALPHYMVPSIVVFLDEMPRTPNGKTDRKALPEPDWSLIGRDTPFVEPRDEIEQKMAKLWERELRLDRIGVHDDFFELGVESLVAARLFARIEDEFGIELPVGTVFANPTVEGLGKLVRDGKQSQPRWKSLVAIQPRGSRRPVFGVHGGAGTILLFGELARRLEGNDVPFYGLQAQGLYGRDPVHQSVTDMAAAYIPQIREVQPKGPYVLAGYCFGALVAYEIAQQLRAAGEAVDLVASINGPSLGYIHRHDPDGILADDDETVERTPPPPPRGWEKLRRKLRNQVRRVQLQYAFRLNRPLALGLRESNHFQWLSMRAQFRYEPQPYEGRMAVFRAAGLYVEDDLGWGENCSGPIDCYEVPGHQPIARWTMKEPTVGFVASHLSEILDSLEHRAAPAEPQPATR